MNPLIPTAVAAVVLAAGCGGTSSSASDAKQDSSPAVSAAASPSSALDASAVAQRLKDAGIPIIKTFTVTEANDPNHLLGRPNGYSSKVVVTDSRVPEADRGDVDGVGQGAAIEVFPTAAGAKARADYIAAIRAKAPMLANEYDYVSGAVLVRVTGLLTPTQAKDYEKAL